MPDKIKIDGVGTLSRLNENDPPVALGVAKEGETIMFREDKVQVEHGHLTMYEFLDLADTYKA